MGRNPYIVGAAVFQPNFYGRKTLVNELLDDNRKCIYLIGNRRTGKTSILRCVEDNTRGVGLFLNLQGTRGKTTLMSQELVRQIRKKAQKMPVLSRAEWGVPDDVCDVIETLADVAEANQLPVVLLWDEAEKLLELDAQQLECLRSALQDKRYLRTIITATKALRRLNHRPYTGETSPFLHGFETHYVSPLSDEEVADLVRQVKNPPEDRVQASDALLSEIIDLTGNHPFLVQVLCQRLFDDTSGKLRSIAERDLAVDDRLSSLFEIDYETLLPDEQTILRALSKRDASSEQDLRSALELETEHLHRCLLELGRLGYVRYDNGSYWVASHYLRTWLEKFLPRLPGALASAQPPAPLTEGASVSEDVALVQRQLAEARADLKLIEERISQYVLSTDVPLQLIKERRRLQELVARLGGKA